MPEFQIGAGAGILIDDRDETRLNNKCNLAHGIGAEDVTCFQPVAFAKEYAYLLQEGTANWSGFSALDHATLSRQMATAIGANTDRHHVLIGPGGLLVGGEANFFETVQSAFDVGLSLSGVATAGSQFKLSGTGIWDGLVLHASQGAHPIVQNATMLLAFTDEPGDQILTVSTTEGESATFTLGGFGGGGNIAPGLQTLINSLSAYADAPVTVTGTPTASGGGWTGLLTLSFAGGVAVEVPSIVGGAIQSLAVTGGDGGNYSFDGCGNFELGASAASVQALVRALGGDYAAVAVDGSSTAPTAAVQTVTFANVPSPVWAAVQGTGNSALSDVADPTVNADWITAIQDNAAYAGQTVSASGAITLSGGLLSGTLTFTFSGGPVPVLKVVTGVIDTVTASAAVTIDGVTVTPGDAVSVIQTNLRGAGGHDAAVYVTGSSVAPLAGNSNELTFAGGGAEFAGTFQQAGMYAGYPYFQNGSWLLYYVSGLTSWVIGNSLGEEPGNNGSGWLHAYLPVSPPSGSNDPNHPELLAETTEWSAFEVADVSGMTVTYTAASSGTSGSLNLTLLYPTAATAYTPTVTVGTLTQTAALGTALANAAVSQTTAGVAGSGNYRFTFPPGVTPTTATATGTGAVPGTPTAPGTVATPVVSQPGGETTSEIYNLVIASGTDAWVDSGALPEGVSPTPGVVARAHVLSVSGTGPALVIEVQHADDNGSNAPDLTTLATVETFAEVTAPGVLTIRDPAATLKRWRRCNYTVGGTNPEFVFCVAMATF